MKKFLIFLISCIISSTGLFAQGIKTSFSEKIVLTDNIGFPQHTFYPGQNVTVYAYKKKSGRYHFLIETYNYAASISCNRIPFYATEKDLKKLPDALSSEADVLLSESRLAVERRLNQKCKEKALSGGIYETLYSPEKFELISGTKYKLKKEEKVYIIGRKSVYSDIYYAMYGERFAGIYKTPSSYSFIYSDVDMKRIPSVDDPDVRKLLAEKQMEIEQRQTEAKVKYRSKALNGNIKGIISSFAPDPLGNVKARYLKGDTTSIIGYSQIGDEYYFALYTDNLVGTFKHSWEPQFTFKNSDDIEFDLLPSYDDP